MRELWPLSGQRSFLQFLTRFEKSNTLGKDAYTFHPVLTSRHVIALSLSYHLTFDDKKCRLFILFFCLEFTTCFLNKMYFVLNSCFHYFYSLKQPNMSSCSFESALMEIRATLASKV